MPRSLLRGSSPRSLISKPMAKVKCVICGKITSGKMAKNGDGTFIYPRKHKHNGIECEGNYYEADPCVIKNKAMTKQINLKL